MSPAPNGAMHGLEVAFWSRCCGGSMFEASTEVLKANSPPFFWGVGDPGGDAKGFENISQKVWCSDVTSALPLGV